MENIRNVVKDIGRAVKWPMQSVSNEMMGWGVIFLAVGLFVKLFVIR